MYYLCLCIQKTFCRKSLSVKKVFEANKDVIHIHGKSDTVFPIKNILSPCIEIPGDHAIILTQYNWLNKNLPNIIQ